MTKDNLDCLFPTAEERENARYKGGYKALKEVDSQWAGDCVKCGKVWSTQDTNGCDRVKFKGNGIEFEGFICAECNPNFDCETGEYKKEKISMFSGVGNIKPYLEILRDKVNSKDTKILVMFSELIKTAEEVMEDYKELWELNKSRLHYIDNLEIENNELHLNRGDIQVSNCCNAKLISSGLSLSGDPARCSKCGEETGWYWKQQKKKSFWDLFKK